MQRGYLLFHRIDYFQSVNTVTSNHDAANGLFSVFIQSAGAKRIPEFYLGDISYVDGRSVLRFDDNIRNVGYRFDKSNATKFLDSLKIS